MTELNFSQTLRRRILICARLTVRAAQPLSIATGDSTPNHDTVVATDANGLPFLPPTSLRGVIRHAYGALAQDREDLPASIDLFGYAREEEGEAARLRFTSGLIHDACDIPVDGLLIDEGDARTANRFANKVIVDELLQRLMGLAVSDPVYHERVRLNARHVTDKTGKFDRCFVPVGARFTFGLSLWSDPDEIDADRRAFGEILGLFQKGISLGGATRSGYGLLRGAKDGLRLAEFDFANAVQLRTWRAAAPRLQRLDQEVDELKPRSWPKSNHGSAPLEIDLEISAEDGWLFSDAESGGEFDEGPMREAEIRKQADRLVFVESTDAGLRFPVSSLKGALRHRTAFQANRCEGRFAPPDASDAASAGAAEPDSAILLFGSAKTVDGAGRPGRVHFGQPQFLGKAEMQARTHNGIDRFTGGVRSGILFDQTFPSGLTIRIPLTIDATKEQAKPLLMALDDLADGLLPLGGDTTSGLGWFRGSISVRERGPEESP